MLGGTAAGAGSSRQNKDVSFDEMKQSYFSDLKTRSEYPDTIDDSIMESNWERVSVETNCAVREEFGNNKKSLIAQWEKTNGTKWPVYESDVYSKSGKLIRRKGDKYDAHHVQPIMFGGKNIPNNITPLHAGEHFDKQGVHAPDSPFGQMTKKGEINGN